MERTYHQLFPPLSSQLLMYFKHGPAPFSVTPDAVQTCALLSSPLEGFSRLLPCLLSSSPVLPQQTVPRAASHAHLIWPLFFVEQFHAPCGPLNRTLAYQAVAWPHLLLQPHSFSRHPSLQAAMLLIY